MLLLSLPQPALQTTVTCSIFQKKKKERFAHLFVDLRYQKMKLQIMYYIQGVSFRCEVLHTQKPNYDEKIMHLKMIISLESIKFF